MKLTRVIQLCKNVFAVNNDIIVLTFHAQDLTKDCDRGMHGRGQDKRPGPGKRRRIIFPTGQAGKRYMSLGWVRA